MSLGSSESEPVQIVEKPGRHDGACGRVYSDSFTMECNNCMMVAMGEKATFMGMPCDTCGKIPRPPYGY